MLLIGSIQNKMLKKVIAILQVRSASTRLPNKIHLKINDKSILEIISQRLCNLDVKEKWLATTTLNSDDRLADIGLELGWKVFRGSSKNVLSRFESIISFSDPDYVIRLTGDNPLVEASGINYILKKFYSTRYSPLYLSDFDSRLYPIGAFPEIFEAAYFKSVNLALNPKLDFHLSHVTSWLRKNVKQVEMNLGNDYPSKPGWRWTLDTKEDYDFLTQLDASTSRKLISLNYKEIVSHLEGHPELVFVNKNVQVKNIELG
jgi:spore coat polysaccharide biosynthesis protein SpsF (cytidylyltransferase family)